MEFIYAEAVTAKVAILLCTYNGAEYLSAQLDSLVAQTHKDWVIYVSDDGSSDATLDILKRYQSELGEKRLVILGGPRQGFAKNFMSLVKMRTLLLIISPLATKTIFGSRISWREGWPV